MCLREPLVDHVQDRRHLGHARQCGRGREDVVQQVDPERDGRPRVGASARRARASRGSAPPPGRASRGRHPASARLRPRARRRASARGLGRARAARDESPRIELAAARLAGNEVEQVEPDPQRHQRPYASSTWRSELSSERRTALRPNQLAVRSRSPNPASLTWRIVAARSSGSARRRDEAVLAFLDELGRGVVRARDDDARSRPATPPRRRRGRSPRAPTAAAGTARARVTARIDARWRRRTPAPRRRRSSPARRSAAAAAGAIGTVAEDLAREARGATPAPARAAGAIARTRFSGMWRPAKTTTRLRLRDRRLERPGVELPARAIKLAARTPRRAAGARGAGEAEGLLADADAAPLHPPADLARATAEVVVPVGARPDLVPVDDEPKPRGGGARRRRRAGRSTGTSRCARRRSGAPWRGRWRSTPDAEDERRQQPAAAVRVELHPRADRHDVDARRRRDPPRAATAAASDTSPRGPPARAARRGCGTSARRHRSCTG